MPQASADRSAASGEWMDKERSSLTRVIVTTRLQTNGERWRSVCSCGWESRTYQRRAAAHRKFEDHKEAHRERVYA